MVYASFEETSRDERFDAVLDRPFVHAGEFAVSVDLLRRSSCGFTSQSATYVQLPQLSQCSLS